MVVIQKDIKQLSTVSEMYNNDANFLGMTNAEQDSNFWVMCSKGPHHSIIKTLEEI